MQRIAHYECYRILRLGDPRFMSPSAEEILATVGEGDSSPRAGSADGGAGARPIMAEHDASTPMEITDPAPPPSARLAKTAPERQKLHRRKEKEI